VLNHESASQFAGQDVQPVLHRCRAPSSHLVQRPDVWRQAAVHAQHLAIYQCLQGHMLHMVVSEGAAAEQPMVATIVIVHPHHS
jgi:hypothetical protein